MDKEEFRGHLGQAFSSLLGDHFGKPLTTGGSVHLSGELPQFAH